MLCKVGVLSSRLKTRQGLKPARESEDASEQQVQPRGATAIPPFLPSLWRSCIALFQSSSFSLDCCYAFWGSEA